jgi:hypothetical protein
MAMMEGKKERECKKKPEFMHSKNIYKQVMCFVKKGRSFTNFEKNIK